MLYFDFKNYEEFKELFAVREFNGKKSRQNKILLSLYKDRAIFHDSVNGKLSYEWHHVSNMVELYNMACYALRNYKLFDSEKARCTLELRNSTYYSSVYSTDDMKGLCEDGSVEFIRYVNHDRNYRVFKMRAGKLFRAIIEDNTEISRMPEQVKVYLAETFASQWVAYATSEQPDNQGYTLHVDRNFAKIYDGDYLKGCFHSCMVNEDRHEFYENAVKAKAAYLTDEDDDVVARCIIFTDVTDEEGKTWRLAERQYSSESDERLMRILVQSLIHDGHIDGYKQIGAGCGDSKAFVANDGTDLSDKVFSIDCNLETDDVLSYQDSFKYYNYNKSVAYNDHHAHSYDYNLDTTDRTLCNDDCWSEYNNCYISDDDAVWVSSRDDYFYDNQVVYAENTRNNEFEDDCIEIDGCYYYAGRNAESPDEYGIYRCAYCDEYMVGDDAYYSEITEEYYCCGSCMESAEEAYKKENWTYSEYDDEYFEDSDDVCEFKKFTHDMFVSTTISRETMNEMLSCGEMLYSEDDDAYYLTEEFNEMCAANEVA